MLRSCLTRLLVSQHIFRSQIHTTKNVYHVHRLATFEDESIPHIRVPQTMVKKLEKIKYKKELKELKAKKFVGRHCDLIITCKRKEFNHYRGQTYKGLDSKSLASGGWKHKLSKGDYFTVLPRMKNPALESEVESFSDLQLDERIVQALAELGFTKPTNIQSKMIPHLRNGKSVHCAAETGNGKTLAFLLPIMEKILKVKENMDPLELHLNKPIGVIVVPMRELADQIFELALKLGDKLNINIHLKCGGRGTQGILRRFEVSPVDLVIATPGILSKLLSTKYYNMENLSIFTLDEVDTLFDDSFSEVMTNIIMKLKVSTEKPVLPDEGNDLISPDHEMISDLQVVLSGATMPLGTKKYLDQLLDMSSMELVTTPYLNCILPHVTQKFMRLGPDQKPEYLTQMLKANMEKKIPTIVFCNKPQTVDFLTFILKDKGINLINFHANMPQKVREGRFSDYQTGLVDILVCTDLGSRGLDTVRTRQIINYDFPLFMSDYIHRAGRVGRVGSPNGCMIINYVVRFWDVDLLWKIEVAIRRNEQLTNVNANIKRKLEGLHSTKNLLEEQQKLLDMDKDLE